jgi:hypothetical protein
MIKARVKATGKLIDVVPYGDEFAQLFPEGDFKVYTKDELIMTEQEMQIEIAKEQGKANMLRQEIAEMNKEHEYWQQVRIQAAIAAMQGMVISDAYCSEEPVGPLYQIKRRKWPPAKIAKEAVAYADFLIAELKKGGEDGSKN